MFIAVVKTLLIVLGIFWAAIAAVSLCGEVWLGFLSASFMSSVNFYVYFFVSDKLEEEQKQKGV